MREQYIIEACKPALCKVAERIYSQNRDAQPDYENCTYRYDIEIIQNTSGQWKVELYSTDPDMEYAFPGFSDAVKHHIAGISEASRGNPGRVINGDLIFDTLDDLALALNTVAKTRDEKIDLGMGRI